MFFRRGELLVLNAISTNSRAVHKMADAAEGTQAALRLLGIETDHIHGGIKFFPLHGFLERRFICPVALDQTCAWWERPSLAAVKTRHLMALANQKADQTRADVSRAADYEDFHGTIRLLYVLQRPGATLHLGESLCDKDPA